MHRILRLTIIFGFLLALLAFFVISAPAAPQELRPRQFNDQIKFKAGEVLVKFKSSATGPSQNKVIKQIGGKVINKIGSGSKAVSSKAIKQYRKKRNALVRAIRKFKKRKKLSSTQKKRIRVWQKKLKRLDNNWKRTIKKISANQSVQLLKLNKGVSTEQAVNTLKNNKNVIFAEPNYYYQALYTPNDTWYTTQWGLNNTGQLIWGYYGNADADIDAAEGWDIEQGSSRSVTVAVIDSGIQFDHPDLDTKIWANGDETAGNGIDDDGNGYVDDRNGYNWAGISQWFTTTSLPLNQTSTTPSDAKPDRIAQGIEGTGQTLTHVGISVVKTSLRPLGDITVNIRSGSPTGSILSTMTIEEYEVDNVGASEVYKALNTAITLTNGSMYYIELVPTYSDSQYRYFSVGVYEENPATEDEPYVEGDALVSTDDGVSFHAPTSGTTTTDTDLFFRTNANPYPHDDNQHGTHVSGIIASEPNNAQGVAGLSSAALIMPLKTFDSGGVYVTNPLSKASDIALAIDYAKNNGANIVNMSFGGTSNSQTIQDAITNAYNSGVILFAAAGNSGSSTTYYPAANDNVIGVGATNNTDARAYFSTYNSSVDISAPGHAIISTVPTDLGIIYPTTTGYDFMSGTSMASPMVAGVAALVRAKYPSYTASQVGLLVTRLSDDLGAVGRDDSFGYGRLNAQKALLDDTSAPSKPVVTSASHVKSASIYSNNDPSFSFTSTDNTEVSGYSFSLTRSSKTTPDAKKDSATTTKSYKNIKNGRWYFHVRATDNFGNWSGAAHYRINIDTYRPVISAPRSATVIKGAKVRLYYKIKDYFSGSKKADAIIRIRKGKSVVKTIKLGWVPVNVLRSYLFNANLNAGTYVFSIYATDKTGNTQSKVDSNTLTIKPKPKPKKPKPPGGGGEEDAPVNPNPGLPWAP